MTSPATPAPPRAGHPGSVNRWVGLLAQFVPAHPELAALIQALVTTPPDEPDETGSRDQNADPERG